MIRARIGSPVVKILVCVLLTGCAATEVPEEPPDDVRSVLEAADFDRYRVGVSSGGRPPVYASSLVNDLRETGLFAEVAAIDSLGTPPHLLAVVRGRISGPNVIPIFTLISLGVVPTFYDDKYGVVFSLEAYRAEERDSMADTVYVRVALSGRSVLGLAGLPLSLGSGWKLGDARLHRHYYQWIAYAIASRAPDIHGLLEAPDTAVKATPGTSGASHSSAR